MTFCFTDKALATALPDCALADAELYVWSTVIEGTVALIDVLSS